VERVLAEEGFERLPRRTQLKVGLTAAGAAVPDKAEAVSLGALDGRRIESDAAGIFLCTRSSAQLGLDEVVAGRGPACTKTIPP